MIVGQLGMALMMVVPLVIMAPKVMTLLIVEPAVMPLVVVVMAWKSFVN